MKAEGLSFFTDTHLIIFGLILFVSVFFAFVFWVFRKNAVTVYREAAALPLEEPTLSLERQYER